jgi:hypothetical protein
MKKIWNVLIVLLLMGAVFPLALADDADDSSEEELIDEETQEEVGIMGNSYGASIRLLQLEKSITRNIAKGELIISYLESNTSVNTTLLEAFLSELKLLKDEVSSADPNASDAVEVFVDLKLDAINISKEFRDTLHSLVDNTTREAIEEQIKNMYNESVVESIGQEIRSRIRLYNGVQLKKMAGYFGKYNSSLIEQYKNGSCNMSQVKQKIAERVCNMSIEDRQGVYSKIKQLRLQKKVQVQNCIANVTQGLHERRIQRLQSRLNNVQGLSNGAVEQALKNRLSEKIGGGNGKGGGR